ncbi:hypothetical protein ACFU7Y_37250 [Kitasatospora sp. NPDC057542]|uniref:hypothetical protein n=1 Tax=Kitasatospora sp. NPDC057542 TaxID=3346162 RepID=UPI0036A7ADC7
MQTLHAEAAGLVSVERSQFGLWERSEFIEDGNWLNLPLSEKLQASRWPTGRLRFEARFGITMRL